ncbi:MAG: hypothetical protein ACTSRI_06260 [Promethearchaeota archaeon]
MKQFFLEENYYDLIFYINYREIKPISETVFFHGILIGLIGSCIFFFTFERFAKHTKYIFTLISLFFFHVIILKESAFLGQIFLIFYFLTMFLILIWFYQNLRKEFQEIIAFIMNSQILFLFGVIIATDEIKDLNIISPLISPLLIVIGAVISIIPFFFNIKIFSRTVIHWGFLIAVNVGLFFFAMYLFFFFNLNSILILLYINISIMIYATYRIHDFKAIKSLGIMEEQIKIKEIDDDRKDFLKKYEKPKKITANRIKYCQENQICLVCNKKVFGFNNYICKCNALYCEKCARVLIESFDFCWACNEPLDNQKP